MMRSKGTRYAKSLAASARVPREPVDAAIGQFLQCCKQPRKIPRKQPSFSWLVPDPRAYNAAIGSCRTQHDGQPRPLAALWQGPPSRLNPVWKEVVR
jgi:hypothetical protein